MGAASSTKKSKPGSVRIIGGTWRRHRIVVPEVAGLRPTPDRVRETLFNWLEPILAGAHCLDLYAGSGVLGFEALSRGAEKAVLVECDSGVAAALNRVRQELKADAQIVCADVDHFLAGSDIGQFDIVFVDPPYSEAVSPVLEALLARLKSGACIYLERERGDQWPELARLEWSRRSAAGGIAYGLAEVSV